MYIDLEARNSLQFNATPNWRLMADRGLRCYNHSHKQLNDPGAVASCEINFLIKMSLDEADRDQESERRQDARFSYTSATRRAGQFKCVGAIRKAGFLSVKKWILKRRQSIELARKQGWKRYWVCLRGTALLFHSVIEKRSADQHLADQELENQIDLLTWIQTNCSSQTNLVTNLLQSESIGQTNGANSSEAARDAFFQNISQCYIEREPKHLIIIDGSIAQPIPEHPRRDFVFCLSTTFGDAYLFQASCQLESDNWISAIHNACAASIARDLTRDEAIKLFETKISHFEVEAEKKIFLKQRLESRLTSMSSMCHTGRFGASNGTDSEQPYANTNEMVQDKNKLTLRTLLYQLNQQMLALDTYIEQLHCEVYQLRCYLSSCGAQNMFYQHVGQQQEANQSGIVISTDLPHPKSLLIHVSKPTKLLLIKLGIFTVSSFHAYIHARQDSAKTILQQIQRTTDPSSPQDADSSKLTPLLELRIRSHSISKTMMTRTENVKLQSETEDLLEMTNLTKVEIRLNKNLVTKIKGQPDGTTTMLSFEINDDSCSIQDFGESICLNLKVNPHSTSTMIVKQALKIIEPSLPDMEFLNYFLRLVLDESEPTKDHQDNQTNQGYYVAKKKETLADWSSYSHIELMEKVIFRVELTRCRMQEEAAAPFGISIEGQLYTGRSESLLNVYCSYIEWGSAADKAGLLDEDELLLVNGIPLGDLDLMFVECLIQDASKLKVVVRSNRLECPSQAKRLNTTTWHSLDGDGDDGGPGGERDDEHHPGNNSRELNRASGVNQTFVSTGSQVISDEYLTSLVCPPPPSSKSGVFLDAGANILRQKSDLCLDKSPKRDQCSSMAKSNSQQQIDTSTQNEECLDAHLDQQPVKSGEDVLAISSSADLAKQLLHKTERLSKLLGKEPISDIDRLSLNANLSSSSNDSRTDASGCERLKKSILELIETEYAYIRHLETIVDHYMTPLEENKFLNIPDLRAFHQAVVDVLCLQHGFFHQLTKGIASFYQIDLINLDNDDFERLNRIVSLIDNLKLIDEMLPLVREISRIFEEEADKFKLYASYCVAYSRLQSILHSKRSGATTKHRGCAITSIPSTLNTFSSSIQSTGIAGLSSFGGQSRDSRLISLDESTNRADKSSLIKQLIDFLSSLDSSSSSISSSLPKSSGDDQVVDSKLSTVCPISSETARQRVANSSVSSTSHLSRPAQNNVHQQNFESYLIKPIQRLVKYPMLLNSIALTFETQARDDADLLALQRATQHIESVVNYVNETQRIHDEFGLVLSKIEKQFQAQRAFETGKITSGALFGLNQLSIKLDTTQLLYWGTVEWLNVDEFSSKVKNLSALNSVVFVFASCVILICKESYNTTKRKPPFRPFEMGRVQNRQAEQATDSYPKSLSRSTLALASEVPAEIVRYQTLIPVGEVQVRSVSTERRKERGFEWELFQCSSSNSNSRLLTNSSTGQSNRACSSTVGRRYLLSSVSSEHRSSFLKKIRYIIRDSVRNMNLPATRSPPSGLKKLSTSSETSANSNGNLNSSLSQTVSTSPADINESTVLVHTKACEHYNCASDEQNRSSLESAIKVNS